MIKGINVLYISYDGILDPLGQSQILPYIAGLAEKGINYNLLTFEKRITALRKRHIEELKRKFSLNSIRWEYRSFHKHPRFLSKIFDAFLCLLSAAIILHRDIPVIIHARSYFAGIMALILKKISGTIFLFDMRGFWVDERKEAGMLDKCGFLYRIGKNLEKTLIKNSDGIISLTKKGAEEIKSFDYMFGKKTNIEVIPTCVDLEKFNFTSSGTLRKKFCGKDLQGRFVVVYSGSVSTWFMTREMLDFFKVLRGVIPNAYFLALTPEMNFLKNIFEESKICKDDFIIMNLDYEKVSDYICIADVGLAFYAFGHSGIARCPTKVGEYLACGLPLVINKGIGDIEEIITEEGVGQIVSEFSHAQYHRVACSLRNMLAEQESLRKKCRHAAEKYFSLDKGVEKYLSVYNRLLSLKRGQFG